MIKHSALIWPVLLGILALACTQEEVSPAPTGDRQGKVLGVATTDLPADSRDQALRALEQDAFRRESRFLDAVNPGHLFGATRVEQAEIEAGFWTHDELFQIGAQIFQLTFTSEVGFGGEDLPIIRRFHTGRRGGPDARRCAACHWRGGPAGAGDGADDAYLDGDGDSQSSTLARNPPSLAGGGWVEMVAAEMTAELQSYRDNAIIHAKENNKTVNLLLTAKGVHFGSMVITPDGNVDTSGVVGVDLDLVIRPFGWKGSFSTLRDAVEDALLIHHGMESEFLVAQGDVARVGSFGGMDPDGDGVIDEISEGQVSALTLFLAMAETPQQVPPPQGEFMPLLAEGISKFETLGCATCHTPHLTVTSPLFRLPSRSGGPSIPVDLSKEAAEPRLLPNTQTGEFQVPLYSDLKRHDMGPELAEGRPDRGVAGNLFLTRPLWGVARSRPYLHDGHAPTLEDAILLHGGEGQASRDAYAALDDAGRAPIRVLLTSLTRARRITVP
ncbi:MAG: hypothetical protein IPK82_14730 [Polyangiaceae bacterium]|nr:hypothetical protein [Polyangiaceae bacterium]